MPGCIIFAPSNFPTGSPKTRSWKHSGFVFALHVKMNPALCSMPLFTRPFSLVTPNGINPPITSARHAVQPDQPLQFPHNWELILMSGPTKGAGGRYFYLKSTVLYGDAHRLDNSPPLCFLLFFSAIHKLQQHIRKLYVIMSKYVSSFLQSSLKDVMCGRRNIS